MSVKDIEVLASRMRSAIESLPRELLPSSMSMFPRGACGDASQLLGAYLFDNGFDGFKFVFGARGRNNSRHSHAWLVRDSLIVDITADQFPDNPSAVIVVENSEWHKSFEDQDISTGDFRASINGFNSYLSVVYSRLKPLLFADGMAKCMR